MYLFHMEGAGQQMTRKIVGLITTLALYGWVGGGIHHITSKENNLVNNFGTS